LDSNSSNNYPEAFGFSKWRKKKLPSKETRTNNPNLAREAEENATKSGSWSTLVQSVMAAAEHVALILYPCNPDSLLRAASRGILKSAPISKVERERDRLVSTKAKMITLWEVMMRFVRTL